MKRLLLYIICVVAAVESYAATDSLTVQPRYEALANWEVANQAYIDGDYAKAKDAYKSIEEGGAYSMKLYYNLANSYFKLGEIGKAILYYNRALRLAPASDDIRHNLAIAEAQTKDRIAVVPEFFLNRWMRAVRNSMSCMAWSIISLVALAVLLSALLLFLLASRLSLRKTGFYVALCAIMLFVMTTIFALSSRNDMLSKEWAVVMSSAISVKSSPDRAATDIFVLHEGTKLRIVSRMGNWCEVVIADGKKGWTEKGNLEEI